MEIRRVVNVEDVSRCYPLNTVVQMDVDGLTPRIVCFVGSKQPDPMQLSAASLNVHVALSPYFFHICFEYSYARDAFAPQMPV